MQMSAWFYLPSQALATAFLTVSVLDHPVFIGRTSIGRGGGQEEGGVGETEVVEEAEFTAEDLKSVKGKIST